MAMGYVVLTRRKAKGPWQVVSEVESPPLYGTEDEALAAVKILVRRQGPVDPAFIFAIADLSIRTNITAALVEASH